MSAIDLLCFSALCLIALYFLIQSGARGPGE